MIGSILKLFFGEPDKRADGRMPLVDRVMVVDNKFIKETGVADLVYPYKKQDEQLSQIGDQIGDVYKIDPMVKKKMPNDQIGILSSLLNFDYNYTINFYKQSLEVGFKQLYYTSRIYEINLGIYTMMFSKYAKEIELIKGQLEINEWQLEANVNPWYKKTAWLPLADAMLKGFSRVTGSKFMQNFSGRRLVEKAGTLNPFGIAGNMEILTSFFLGGFPSIFQYNQDGTDRTRIQNNITPTFTGGLATNGDKSLDLSTMRNMAIDYSGFKADKVNKEYRKALKKYIKDNNIDPEANPVEYREIQKKLFRETVVANMKNTGRWTNLRGIKSINDLKINGETIFKDEDLDRLVNQAIDAGGYRGLDLVNNYDYLMQNIKNIVNKEASTRLGFTNDRYAEGRALGNELANMDRRTRELLDNGIMTEADRRDYFQLTPENKRKFSRLTDDDLHRYLSADNETRQKILDDLGDPGDPLEVAKRNIEAEVINTKVINTEVINVLGRGTTNANINNGLSVQNITGISNPSSSSTSGITSSTTMSDDGEGVAGSSINTNALGGFTNTEGDNENNDSDASIAEQYPGWESYKREYTDLYKDTPREDRPRFLEFILGKVRARGDLDIMILRGRNRAIVERTGNELERNIDKALEAAEKNNNDKVDTDELSNEEMPKPDKNGNIDYNAVVSKWLTRGVGFATGMGLLYFLPQISEFLSKNKDVIQNVSDGLTNIGGDSLTGIVGITEKALKGIMGIMGVISAIGRHMGIDNGIISNAVTLGGLYLGFKHSDKVVKTGKAVATGTINAVNALKNSQLSPGTVVKNVGKNIGSAVLKGGLGALKFVAGGWKGKIALALGAGYGYNQLFQQGDNNQMLDSGIPKSDIEINNLNKKSKIPTYTGNPEIDKELYDWDQIKAGNNAITGLMATGSTAKKLYNKINNSPDMINANKACGKKGFKGRVKDLQRILSSVKNIKRVGAKGISKAIGRILLAIGSKLIPIVGWASMLFSAGLFIKYYLVDGRGFWWSIIASLVTQGVADEVINFFGGEDKFDNLTEGKNSITENDIKDIKKSSEKLSKDITTYNSNIDTKTGALIDNTTGKKVLAMENIVSGSNNTKLNDKQQELVKQKANQIKEQYNSEGGRSAISIDNEFIKNVVSKSDLVTKMFEASDEYLNDGSAITLFLEKGAKKPKTNIELRKRVLGKLIAAGYKYTGNKYKLAIESSIETRNKKEPDALEVLKNEIFGGSRKNIDETSTSDNNSILANWSVSSSAVLPDTSSNVKPGLSNPGYDTPTTITNETKNNSTSPTTEATNVIGESMTSANIYTDPELLNGVTNVNDTLINQTGKQIEAVELQKKQLIALERLNSTMSSLKVSGTGPYSKQPTIFDVNNSPDDINITDEVVNNYQDGSANIVSTPYATTKYTVTWISKNGSVNERKFNNGENATKFYNELKTKGIEKSMSNSNISTTKVNTSNSVPMVRRPYGVRY